MPMTHRERVLAAVRRQVPDRVPRHIQIEPYVAARLRSVYDNEDLTEALGGDLRFIWPNNTCLQNDYSPYYTQSGVTWEEWGRGRIWDNQMQYAAYLYPLEQAETVDEILAYPWPDLDQPYRYQGFDERVQAFHDRGYAVAGGLSETVFEIAWQLRSMERLFEDIHLGDEKAVVLLDAITERRVAVARAYAAAGVDLIHLGDDVAMQTGLMMSKKMWRQWFRPRLVRVIEAARAVKPDVVIEYHSDGKINDLVPDLIEAGVDVLNPVQPECVDHAWVKASYGQHIAFSGGLGVQSVLPFGTPEQVREHVRTVITTLGGGGGLIVGPSHVVERDVPVENFIAMIDAINESGSYEK